MKSIIWTHHAVDVVFERKIDPAWVEAAVREPDWTSPDPHDPDIERRYRVTAGHGGRILRVPVVETEHHVRVITATWDRNARRPL